MAYLELYICDPLHEHPVSNICTLLHASFCASFPMTCHAVSRQGLTKAAAEALEADSAAQVSEDNGLQVCALALCFLKSEAYPLQLL